MSGQHNSKDIEDVLHTFHKLMTRSIALENKPKTFDTGVLLYRAEIHTIQAIGHWPDINVNHLAERLEVTKGAVSQMVRKLETKGLVSKSKDPDNAKEVKLNLTELGWTGFHKHEAFHEHMHGVFKDYFGQELNEKMALYKEVLEELIEVTELFEKRVIDF